MDMTQSPLQIDRLVSGGIITNYHCSSTCKHCVYSCSPHWPKDNMTEDAAQEIFQLVQNMNHPFLHIGGGEPFLDIKGLFAVLEKAKDMDQPIEYIETNASWNTNENETRSILKELKRLDISTLLISMDPFHNEYISFEKVESLIHLCEESNVHVFPWLLEYFHDVKHFPTSTTHTLQEYVDHYGKNYIQKLLASYPMNLKGRALRSFGPYMEKQSLEPIIEKSAPCMELAGTHHFHIDLNKRYIPQTCVGFSLEMNDLSHPIKTKDYPLITRLYQNGIKSLFDYASSMGFLTNDLYIDKCHLCFDIRNFLVEKYPCQFHELQPFEHYQMI